MRIEHLKEFIVLTQTLSFAKAAERLYMTQPALSRHISSIEDEFGVKLFTRTVHGVELTENGHYVLARVRKLVEDYDEMADEFSRLGQHTSARLALGVLYYGIQEYVSFLVYPFEERHPEIELVVKSYQPSTMIEALLKGDIDVAYDFEYVLGSTEDLVTQPIASDQLVILMRADDPLAAKASLSPQDLCDSKLVFTRNVPKKDAFLTGLLDRAGVTGYDRVYTDHVDTLPLTVKRTGSLAIVDKGVTTVNWDGLVSRPIDDERFSVGLGLAHLAENDNPAVSTFVKSLASKAQKRH